MGVNFSLLLPEPSEDTETLEKVILGESALSYVKRVTGAKLTAAVLRLKKRSDLSWAPILCADTTVCIKSIRNPSGDEILGKPQNEAHALEILQTLNGKTHWVHTAVMLQVTEDTTPILRISSTEVEFAKNSTQRLISYVKSNEPMGKAGAYGIQGLGSLFIKKINGSYSGVMGLPIYETTELLDYAKIPFMLKP